MTGPLVLRVITRLNVGGPARQALILSRSLSEYGFRSELVVGSEGAREGTLLPEGHPVTRVPDLRREVNPRSDLRAFRALRRVFRARRPDVVHTHLAKAGALGRFAARSSGAPQPTGRPLLIHTFHGHVLDGYFPPAVSRAFLAAERRLATWTDALVAVSEALKDDLLSLGIGSRAQWRVIPLGLDLGELLESTPGPALARRRLGLPWDGPVVGIVGRLVPVKAHTTFLEAAVRVAGSRADVNFLVAGDGPLRHRLETEARRRLGDRIRFLGWVHDLPALYGALDVGVLCSRSEGTPVALIEAAAAARPVVATRVGGVPEVVLDGRTGILVPPGDPDELASAIVSLLTDRDRADAMAREGRAWVRDRFSAARLVRDVASLYDELLERRPRDRAG
jgi:glycosyltransferase involved in cell wall biosynthesis